MTEQATPGALGMIHAVLDRAWTAMDTSCPVPPPAHWRDLYRTAVAEIAANIIRHAYPPSSGGNSLTLDVQLYEDELLARFSDHGVIWEPGDAPKSPDPLDLPEGGLGLAIARGALDELNYRRAPDGTNHWQLVKRFPASV